MTTPHPLHDIPDADLLVQLKTLVGRSNQLTASVLAHLAEVEARGIYRDLACSSLYAYCVYELRMSEDEAQRRIIAARAVQRFPALLELLETAAMHLTGIVLLAPHLTEENHERLLAAARYRSKREIQKLIATIAPRPDIPARVEPLGPQPRPGRATWAAFLESLSGGVRDLPCGTGPGEAPWAGPDDRSVLNGPAGGSHAPARVDAHGRGGGRCYASDRDARCSADESHAAARVDAHGPAGGSHAPARVHGPRSDTGGGMWCHVDRDARCSADESHAAARVDAHGPAGGSPAPARVDADHPAPELRYKVQFTASEHYVRLLEEARDLLQHKVPNRDIARLHELAMEALVAKLRKRRGPRAERPARLLCGEPESTIDGAAGTRDETARPQAQQGGATASADVASERPQTEAPGDGAAGGDAASARRQPDEAGDGAAAHRLDAAPETAEFSPPPCEEPGGTAPDAHMTGRVAGDVAPDDPAPETGAASATMQSGNDTRSRYVTAAVERAVWRRDEWQCTFIDHRGQRCRERSGLEIHHREAHWRGGANAAENLTLHCRAHNQLMAERELGRQYVRARIEERRAGRTDSLQADECAT